MVDVEIDKYVAWNMVWMKRVMLEHNRKQQHLYKQRRFVILKSLPLAAISMCHLLQWIFIFEFLSKLNLANVSLF